MVHPKMEWLYLIQVFLNPLRMVRQAHHDNAFMCFVKIKMGGVIFCKQKITPPILILTIRTKIPCHPELAEGLFPMTAIVC